MSLPFSRRAERELRPFFACGSRKDIGNPGFIRRGGRRLRTGTIRRLRLRTVRRRVTGLRLRRTSTDRAVVRLRLCGPRTLRAEGLPEDRARGLRSLHTVRARTRRISAVPATGRRMQAVRGPVTRTAAVRVRLTSEVRAAEARAVPAVPADAAAPQPVPHFPSGCGPEPHPRTPDGLDSGSRIRIDKRSVANYHSRHGGVKWQAGHPQWLPKPPPQTGDGSI